MSDLEASRGRLSITINSRAAKAWAFVGYCVGLGMCFGALTFVTGAAICVKIVETWW